MEYSGVRRKGVLTVVTALVLIGFLAVFGVANVFAGGAKEAPKAAVAPEVGNEAPQLAAMVARGELPPLDQRLPTDPMVVEPIDRIGQYGGTWRRPMVGGNDGASLTRTVLYNGLVRWDLNWSEPIPNIAKSVTVSDDSTAFTFQLREGMKWSDGHPFTSADIQFWFDAVLSNEDLTPAGRIYGGVPVDGLEVHGDHSFTIRFSTPSGLFLQVLAGPGGFGIVNYARHYFEQFHPAYNTNIDATLLEHGFGNWVDLFEHKNNLGTNLEQPSLNAWIVTSPYDGTTTEVRFERNPYFWKVDTEGNQLPYLDRVVFDVLQDTEVALLRTMEGQYDLVGRHVATVSNRPLLFQAGERSGLYRLMDTIPDTSTTTAIHPNYNHSDPVKREILHNKDFRIGLSYAIDREEINDLVYAGVVEPWQVAPRRTSAFFDEQFAKQYTEFDVDRANEYLDRAGYAQRDAQGYRLGPDGNRISLAVLVNVANSDQVAEMELIQGYWRNVGIEINIRAIDRSLLWEIKNNAQHDMMVWTGGGGLQPILVPQRYIPTADGAHHAVRWAAWYLNPQGSFAEEPPQSVKRKLELFDAVRVEGNPQRQVEYMKQILEIARDSFRLIGTVLFPPDYKVLRNDFHNVREDLAAAWPYPTPGPWNPEQFYTTRGR